MINKLKTKTQLMSAAMITGAFVSTSAQAQEDFNAYTKAISGEVGGVPDVVAYLCYIGGFCLAGLGVVGLKQHVENPQGTPMKTPLAKLGFGGMMMALPPVVAAIQGSGADAGTATADFGGFGTQDGID